MTDLERLSWVCRGDAEAIKFCLMLWNMVAIYDDIIDKDNPEHEDIHVHSMMYDALFGLPNNKFYQQHFALLSPLMMNAIANWRIANDLERANREADLPVSFVIRSSYVDVLRMVAFIQGGDAHSIEAGIELRRYVHAEGLDAYLKEQQGE